MFQKTLSHCLKSNLAILILMAKIAKLSDFYLHISVVYDSNAMSDGKFYNRKRMFIDCPNNVDAETPSVIQDIPPYSSDLAPSAFYICLHLKIYLVSKCLPSHEENDGLIFPIFPLRQYIFFLKQDYKNISSYSLYQSLFTTN